MSAPALDRRSDYVSAVAVELADLAPDDRSELIEELDDHIAALLEDRPGADLVAELGAPRAYAAELRTAAGLTGLVPPRPDLLDRVRVAAGRAGEAWRRLDAALPWLRPAGEVLRPVWWVARGYIAAVTLVLYLRAGDTGGFWFVIPTYHGNKAIGLLWVAVVVVASVLIGQRQWRRPAARLAVVAVNVLAVWATWSTVTVLADGFVDPSGTLGQDLQTYYVPQCPSQLSNIYPYDAAGRPLQDVRLYDQNGNPFDLSVFGCQAGDDRFDPSAPGVYPYPSAGSTYQAGVEPTGPPTSLAPLPGATVAPTGLPTPTPAPTPSGG